MIDKKRYKMIYKCWKSRKFTLEQLCEYLDVKKEYVIFILNYYSVRLGSGVRDIVYDMVEDREKFPVFNWIYLKWCFLEMCSKYDPIELFDYFKDKSVEKGLPINSILYRCWIEFEKTNRIESYENQIINVNINVKEKEKVEV